MQAWSRLSKRPSHVAITVEIPISSTVIYTISVTGFSPINPCWMKRKEILAIAGGLPIPSRTVCVAVGIWPHSHRVGTELWTVVGGWGGARPDTLCTLHEPVGWRVWGLWSSQAHYDGDGLAGLGRLEESVPKGEVSRMELSLGSAGAIPSCRSVCLTSSL